MRKKILIITVPGDLHADAVAWGLAELGIDCVIWNWSNFPRIDKSFIRFEPGKRPMLNWVGSIRHDGPYDVIWRRRTDKPAAMKESHPDDVAIIEAEGEVYLQTALDVVSAPTTLWVNERNSDVTCGTKLRQLIAASEVGFAVPDTLMGNDPNEVRQFFELYNGNIIYKPFKPGGWIDPDGTRTNLRTSSITAANLERDYSIAACPGIFQPRIEKKYELRVTVIGETVVPALIDSQRDGPTVDWRYEGGQGWTNLRSTVLSSEVEKQCVDLCRRLGLVFGCIDLIVDTDGVVVFLEINSRGQFLWKETADPDIPVLDTLCRFLAGLQKTSQLSNRLQLANYFQSGAYKNFQKSELT